MSETQSTTPAPTDLEKSQRKSAKNIRKRNRNKSKQTINRTDDDKNKNLESSEDLQRPASTDEKTLTKDSSTTVSGAGKKATTENPSGGGKKKKKARRKKAASSLTTTTKSTTVELQLPKLKVTLRNITGDKKNEDTSPEENVRNMIQMLRELVQVRNQQILEDKATDSTNADSSSSAPVSSTHVPLIVLDENSIQKILNRRFSTIQNDDEEEETKDTKLDEDHEGIHENTSEVDGNAEEVKHVTFDSKSEDVRTSNEVDKRTIVARVMYINPFRNSKRRGMIPGNIYLVLSPPVPVFFQEKLDHLAVTNTENSISDITKNIKVMSIDDDSNINGNEKDVLGTLDPDTRQGENVITAEDKSKALAQARILLDDAVESLSKVCTSSNSKNDQKFMGAKVLVSRSQKVWAEQPKRNTRESNKYENTIETDDDFKTFLETKRMTEEERMNRPKPPPGGGVVSSNTKDSKEDNGQPVAAVILHLRDQEAAKERAKVDMKKSKKSTKTTNRGETGGPSSKKVTRKKPDKRARERRKKDTVVPTPKVAN